VIPLELLKNYQGRALGTCVYGNGGLKKTLAVRTLPYPILELDFEGGSGSLGPWTRRIRRWNESKWTTYSQEEREALLELVSPENKKLALYRAAPWIDIVSFDTMTSNLETKSSPAYDHLNDILGNLDPTYNSISVDPLVEFSQLTQSQSKMKSGVGVHEPMHVKLWQGAQERAAIMLRRLRELRDKGVFIYSTSSEFIDKDYGEDPREAAGGKVKEEPYSIKGTFNVPGQLVTKVNHMLDLQFHARSLNSSVVWVTAEEPARSGSFNWEAKDRTGRIPSKYVQPNMRDIISYVYGPEAQKAIYMAGREI